MKKSGMEDVEEGYDGAACSAGEDGWGSFKNLLTPG